MVKFMFLLALAAIFIASIEAINFGDCPLSSQMASCTPDCIEDSQCSAMGGICCPNLCNKKSCVRAKAGSQGSGKGGYKGLNTKTATGTYCGNLKCGAHEKCDFDKSTKRQRCVRA